MNKSYNLKQLIEIFFTFFKIGSFTFGGGYAMIPLIEREVVDRKRWITQEEIIDIFGVSQSVPGAIAINSSILIGYRIAGKKGAISAMLGVVMPSFIAITFIAAFFMRIQDNPVVRKAFLGIRCAVVALIVLAAVKIGKAAITDKLTAVIAAVTVIVMLLFNVHAIFAIIAAALLGIALYLFRSDKAKAGKMTGKDDKNDIS